MPERSTRTAKLDLRLTPEAKKKLQTAAETAGRTVSEFVLESPSSARTKRSRTVRGLASMPIGGRRSWRPSTHRLATCLV